MNAFQIALQALQLASATASAAASARRIYENIKAQAARTGELTPEEVAKLDAEAEKIFYCAEQAESGR